MLETIARRQETTRQDIESELAARVQDHQAKIAGLRRAMDAGRTIEPVVFLAQGDSWFDYPLQGNDVTTLGTYTDVLAQLRTLANDPVILSLAHYGETSTGELSLSKQKRMRQALQDSNNWMSKGKPDAILFSAGGNDIAGEQFCVFLDYAGASATGLDEERFQKVLGMVQASYEALFKFRDSYATGVPVFGHCYDFAKPSGVGLPCNIGPWLQPSLIYCGCNDIVQGTGIVTAALSRFRDMLFSLATDPSNNFYLVETQGQLVAGDWANELHPTPEGFEKIAKAFLQRLRQPNCFPGRI